MDWIVFGATYCLIGLFFGFVIYNVSDPYGHLSPLSRWAQAILGGALWVFCIFYVMVYWLYRTYFKRSE